MTDAQIIEKLEEAFNGTTPLAEALGVTRQTIWDWKRRGIHGVGRFGIEKLARERGIRISKDFSAPRKRKQANGRAK